MRVQPNQVWMLGEAIVVVLHELVFKEDEFQKWWRLLDLETGQLYHLGDDAFTWDESDVLLHEAEEGHR